MCSMQTAYKILLALWLINRVQCQLFCSDFHKREKYVFHPTRHCQRSNNTQISATNVDSFEKCTEFAKGVRALALNYGRFNSSGHKSPKNLFQVAEEKERRKRNFCSV